MNQAVRVRRRCARAGHLDAASLDRGGGTARLAFRHGLKATVPSDSPLSKGRHTMAYTLACGDVMSGCDARFIADSEEELLAQAAPHAAEVHGITDLSPDVLEAVKGAIKQS